MAPQSIILGIGTGRCGTASLAKILNQQTDAVCSFDEPPLLPWRTGRAPSPPAPLPKAEGSCWESPLPTNLRSVPGEGSVARVIRERFARFRLHGKKRLLGDCASFYLPYIEDAIAAEPGIRIVCLKRPREDVVASFCQWLDQTMPLPTNHWAQQPAPGWHHDPVRTRTFPQYDTQNREEGIRRYWDEYYQRVGELIERYPEHIRLFDTYEALNTEAGQRDLLSFVGIPPERQVLAVGTRVEGSPDRRRRPRQLSDNPMDPRRCVILVPFASFITPPCERAIEELERRGYPVRRVGGYAAIDQGRNQMATDALLDGYEETMWIDADVDFHPDSIDRLRSHRLQPFNQGLGACTHCHQIPTKEFDLGGGVAFTHDLAYEKGVDCSNCHGDVIRGEGGVPRERCLSCHNREDDLKRIDDHEFMHKNHVTDHKIDCVQCHLPIEHSLDKDKIVHAAGDCKSCHPKHHQEQIEMLEGTGAKSIPTHPSSMVMTRAECRTCHRTKEVSITGAVLWKGSAQACLMCHAASEVEKLQSYHQRLRAALPELESAVIAARKALETAKLPEPRTAAIGKELDGLQADLQFLRKANDIHNIHYAAKLIRTLADRASAICRELKVFPPEVKLPAALGAVKP